MSETLKSQIKQTLRTFAEFPLREAGTRLLNTLGYHSQRVGNPGIDAERKRRLLAAAAQRQSTAEKLRIDDWDAFHLLFQVTDEEMHSQQAVFASHAIDDALMQSYLFAALKLSGDAYTRTQLVNITRFVNKQMPQPIMVMFLYGHRLTLAIINRRWDRRAATPAAVGGGGAQSIFWRKSRSLRILICAHRTARISTSSPNLLWITSSKPKTFTILTRCTRHGKAF